MVRNTLNQTHTHSGESGVNPVVVELRVPPPSRRGRLGSPQKASSRVGVECKPAYGPRDRLYGQQADACGSVLVTYTRCLTML